MAPAPMLRLHTALAIAAMFLVAGALWPWSASLRLTCAASAIAISFGLLVARLRAHAGAASVARPDETQSRIDRIRAERVRRMGPRR